MGHLFFSYSRDDSEFAARLARDLREAGAKLWMDKLDIKPGDNWVAEIAAAIKRATALLVVLSPRSVESSNVLDEVSFARHHGKLIFPVLMEPCELPFGLHSLQYIDFFHDYAAAFAECSRSAIALLGSTASELQEANNIAVVRNPSEFSPLRSDALPLQNIRILWVDDRPSNNKYEREMMENLGASFALSTDTSDALRALASWQFDLVLSDMGRPSSATAGYELLSALRAQKNKVPFVIYAGSNSSALKAEAARRGAQGSTNDPRELLELVFLAVGRTRS